MNKAVEKMRKDGYPYKIKGNGGYIAVLYDIQPLSGRDIWLFIDIRAVFAVMI